MNTVLKTARHQVGRSAIRHVLCFSLLLSIVLCIGTVLLVLSGYPSLVIRTILPLLVGNALITPLVAAIAYFIARKDREKVLREITYTLCTGEVIAKMYKEAIAQTMQVYRSLEEMRCEEFRLIWKTRLEESRSGALDQVEKMLQILRTFDSQATPQMRLRDPENYIELAAGIRDTEEKLAELQALTIPPLTEELLQELLQDSQPEFDEIQSHHKKVLALLAQRLAEAEQNIADAKEAQQCLEQE
jgi:hypothetical protein